MSNLKLNAQASTTLRPSNLEKYVREALASRQLPSSLEAKIRHLELQQTLSHVEIMLLDVLNDAIHEGYVIRTSS